MVVPRNDGVRHSSQGSGQHANAAETNASRGHNGVVNGGNQSQTNAVSAPIPIANANSTSTTTATNSSSAFSTVELSSSATNSTAPSTSYTSKKSKEQKRGLAHFEDLPGTRVGPEDGPWPKPYTILETEEEVWQELRALARPHRAMFVNHEKASTTALKERHEEQKHGLIGVAESPSQIPVPAGDNDQEMVVAEDKEAEKERLPRVTVVDSVNFQPCRNVKTQDRYVVTQLDVHGETWTLAGVFDGHLGDVTVEHVAHHLPIIIRDFLKDNLSPPSSSGPASSNPGSYYDPAYISTLFQSAITAFDDAIAHDVLDLFGGSVDKLANYTDAEIRSIINDNHHVYGSPGQIHGGPLGKSTGENWRKARLCMYGTTALVALVDPRGEGVWVANLGDCLGVLVTHTVVVDDSDESSGNDSNLSEEGEWTVEVLTTMHNGDNDEELARIRSEHPGEEHTCIVDRRVLGALAPTRCLGDIPFKQHPDFTRRILYNLYPFVHNTAPWEEFLMMNQTPPYISSHPEVVYRGLKDEIGDDILINGQEKRRSRLSAVLGLEKLATGIKKKDKKNGGKRLPSPKRRVRRQRYLVLASDGFTDLCMTGGGIESVVKSWAKEMVQIGTPKKEVEEVYQTSKERDAAAAKTTGARTKKSSSRDPGRPMSPVSPTSPVPFTGGSFSSSVTSFAIPNVDPSTSTSSISTAQHLPMSQSSSANPPSAPPVPKLQRPPLPHTNKSYHCTSTSNMALRLLRRALGGESRDNDKVAKVATIDMNASWVDDTAIVVMGFQ